MNYRTFNQDEDSSYASQTLRLQPAERQAYLPGGFWRRFAATFIDGCVVGLLKFPINLLVQLLFVGLGKADTVERQVDGAFAVLLFSIGLNIAIIAIYYGWFYSNKGATPGKMVFGLKVVDENTGTYIGYGRAFSREVIGKFISGIILLIGFLMAAFRSDKRALHDLLFSTRVIQTR